MNYTSRIILLIDMDCFYCQVEENLDPSLKGKPIAVVQYNQWRGGGIIAVNYPARDKGVTRHMRGNDAREKCPEIILAKVPEVRGKADLSKYRDAGKRVADVLQTFTPHLERASVDEAYLDITEVVEKRISDNIYQVTPDKLPNTFVVGSSITDFVENVTSSREYDESNFKLAVGGIIAEEIRAEVYKVTGYKCSAGIAHNKILAKLVCGLHKPNKQTILPHEAVPELYEKLPIRKIKSLGGKFGNTVTEKLGIEYMGELVKFNQKELAKKFDEKAAFWLYNIARGIDTEPVNTRLISKSIGCCKKFPGKQALVTPEDVKHWLNELAEEISERLEKDFEENNRRAKQMVVSFAQETNGEEISSTRTHPLNSYEQNKIFDNALKVIENNCLKADGSYIVTYLGISVGNFQDVKKVKEITSFFKNMMDNVKKEKKNQVSDFLLEARNDEFIYNKRIVALEHQDPSPFNNKHSEDMEHKANLKSHNPSPKSDSVYSNSTEADDTEQNHYLYYEQVNSDSILDQSFIGDKSNCRESNNDSNASRDSISQEFNAATSDEKAEKTEIPAPSSFFTKYFDENLNRNFNTSKVLVEDVDVNHDTTENDDDDDNDVEDNEDGKDNIEAVCVNKACDLSTSEFRITNFENYYDCIDTKISCPECEKVIHSLEYQSHMDYHFAIKMVKNEAHLYKMESTKRASTSPKSKPTKRKENEGVKSKPIAQYFKSSTSIEINEEDAQNCPECNKRIRLDDWGVHTDFHAAKKLHLEMNVNQIKPVIPVAVSPKVKGQKNIMGFLKRS